MTSRARLSSVVGAACVVGFALVACDDACSESPFGRPCTSRSACGDLTSFVCLDGTCVPLTNPQAPAFDPAIPDNKILFLEGQETQVELTVALDPQLEQQFASLNVEPPEGDGGPVATFDQETETLKITWTPPLGTLLQRGLGFVNVNFRAEGQPDQSLGVTLDVKVPAGGFCGGRNDACVDNVCTQPTNLWQMCAPAAIPEAGCPAGMFVQTYCDQFPCRDVCLGPPPGDDRPLPGEPCAGGCLIGACVAGVCDASATWYLPVRDFTTPSAGCAPPLQPAQLPSDPGFEPRCMQLCGGSERCTNADNSVDEDFALCESSLCRPLACAVDDDCDNVNDSAVCESVNRPVLTDPPLQQCIVNPTPRRAGDVCVDNADCPLDVPCEPFQAGIRRCRPSRGAVCDAGQVSIVACLTPYDCADVCVSDSRSGEGTPCNDAGECAGDACVANVCTANAGDYERPDDSGCAPPLTAKTIDGLTVCARPCVDDGDCGGTTCSANVGGETFCAALTCTGNVDCPESRPALVCDIDQCREAP